jgi:hypothetical protein
MTRARPKSRAGNLVVPRRSTSEKSSDDLSQKDRAHGRRAVLDYFHHVDPVVLFPVLTRQNVATIPEILWELSLGVYLMVKGFKPSPSRLRPASLFR